MVVVAFVSFLLHLREWLAGLGPSWAASPERAISFYNNMEVEEDSRDKVYAHEARKCEITMVRLETETDRT